MKINKRVAIIVLLVLPALLYLVFVYGLKDVFFITLDYVGPSTVEEKIAEDGTVSYDTIPYTIPDFSFINHDGATVTSQQTEGKKNKQGHMLWRDASGTEGRTLTAPLADLLPVGTSITVFADPERRHKGVWEGDIGSR